MQRKKKIIYTGAFRFPEMDAAATRVRLVGECLSKHDYEIEYLSWADGCAADLKSYLGCRYRCMSEFRTHKANILIRALGFLFMGRKTFKWLYKNDSILKNIDALILYNPPALFSCCIYLMSKYYKFPVVLDSTEWYESEHLPGGRYGFVSAENYMRMRWVYPLFKNFISISNYLNSHYSFGKDVNLICVPALCESVTQKVDASVNAGEVVIIYAGNAGRKDRLQEVVRALPFINEVSARSVRLDLYGPTLADLQLILKNSDLLLAKDFMTVHGRVPRGQIMAAYSRASFSVLFREHKRYAFAGFPTKAVESWAAGVPIITNAVGDLHLYCNAKNSIVVEPEGFAEAVLKFLSDYDPVRMKAMRTACLHTANSYFSVESNCPKLKNFAEGLIR